MQANLILERTFDEPVMPEDVLEGGREIARCFDLYRVHWHGSYLSNDGRSMICRFSAVDMESARLALRDPAMDLSRFWSGTVHGGAGTAAPNVVVERSFATPVEFGDIVALSKAKAWCLETHRVKHVHSFFSLDRKRMLCFYAAPDADSVRKVQREVGAPVEAIWPCSPITP